MYLEAFTSAKDPARPDTNEDHLVIVPGRAYAVIDGVTDKSGRRYDGRTGGRIAGELIEQGIHDLVHGGDCMGLPPDEVAATLSAGFSSAYRHYGVETALATDPNLRFAAQVALLLCDASSFRIVVIGDCGVRVDGRGIHRRHHPADAIAATVRAQVFHAMAAEPGTHAARAEVARAYALEGMREHLATFEHLVTEDAWHSLRHRILLECRAAHRSLPPEAVEYVVGHGIKGMAVHRNGGGPLAFPSIDGTVVPRDLIIDVTLPRDVVTTIELFSDGYFVVPRGTTVRDWEHEFRELERIDPAKVTKVLSTKGSGDGTYTDDRTVMIISREPPLHA